MKREFTKYPNSYVSASDTDSISDDNIGKTAEQLAESSNDPKVLRKIAKPIYSERRWNSIAFWLAKNPNTPADVLTELAKNIDVYIRNDVASHPNTPINVIKQLCEDRNGYVRKGVLQNPNISLDIVISFLSDPKKDVQDKAREIVIKTLESHSDILNKLIKAYRSDKDKS